MSGFNSRLPETVDQAVAQLLSDITLNNEIKILTMKEEDLMDLHFSLAANIRNQFHLWTGNEALMESCRSASGNPDLHVDDASMIIIKALWDKVKQSNILYDNE
jgi:hypothetical protein